MSEKANSTTAPSLLYTLPRNQPMRQLHYSLFTFAILRQEIAPTVIKNTFIDKRKIVSHLKYLKIVPSYACVKCHFKHSFKWQ